MKRIIKSVILLLIPLSLSGQIPPVTSQYVLNPLIINPAYAGNTGALNIAAFYRRQWVGITGSPETMTLAIDAPILEGKLGVGLIVANDKIGVTKNTHFSTNYSYKIKMDKGNLSFGLGAGLITTNTKWSDLVVLDPGDENYLSDSHVFVVPEFSFGAFYSYQNYFGGISIPRLLGYQFDVSKNKYTLSFNPGQYYYMINSGYLYTISPKLKFFPSTLITVSFGEKILYDLNAHFIIYDRFWGGLSYRNKRSLAALMQFAVNNQLKIAYTYDFDFGKLGRYSNGSHEIMFRYEFRYKINAISPLIF